MNQRRYGEIKNDILAAVVEYLCPRESVINLEWKETDFVKTMRVFDFLMI